MRVHGILVLTGVIPKMSGKPGGVRTLVERLNNKPHTIAKSKFIFIVCMKKLEHPRVCVGYAI